MIATLRGLVQHLAPPDALIVEVQGVGFHVWTTASALNATGVGQAIFLYTHLIVREDALALYGFDHADQRELFELLLTVPGVGPKMALSVLSSLSPDVLRRAITHDQPEALSRVKGVGKKTAEKIIFALKDKLAGGMSLTGVAGAADLDTEVLAALTALGYSLVEAQTAVQALGKDAPADPAERLRLALAYFAR